MAIIIIEHDSVPRHSRYRKLYAELNDHERSMYKDLQSDVLEALRRSKICGLPWLKGWFSFVIVPVGVEFPKSLKARKKICSQLRIDPENGVTIEVIEKLLNVLAAEGDALIGKLTACYDAPLVDFFEDCYEYAIDTKSV